MSVYMVQTRNQRQMALLDEQTREIEIAANALDKKKSGTGGRTSTSEGLILNTISAPLIAKRLPRRQTGILPEQLR